MAQGEFFRKLLVGDIFHFCRFAPHRRDIQLFAAVEVAPVASGSARESGSPSCISQAHNPKLPMLISACIAAFLKIVFCYETK
jgi:hypothetical protein